MVFYHFIFGSWQYIHLLKLQIRFALQNPAMYSGYKVLHASFQNPAAHKPGVNKQGLFVFFFKDDDTNQPVVAKFILQV